MHFYVHLAVNGWGTHRLPALLMCATIYLDISGLVLAEVKSLSRVNLLTHSLSEVFVWNFPIAISIELIEQVIEI